MALIAYIHPDANFRELSKADIGKYVEDYDGKKLRFERNVPQEVDDDVAEQLLNHDHFGDEFAEIDLPDDDSEDAGESEEAQAQTAKASKKAAKKAASASNKSTEGQGGNSDAPTDTGAGTSTASATL